MSNYKIDLSKYENKLGRKHQVVRMLWTIVWTLGASWLPRSLGSAWKRCLLRAFGAKIAGTAHVYSSAKVYYPANLTMMEHSCLASDVDCYNVAPTHAWSSIIMGAVIRGFNGFVISWLAVHNMHLATQ